MVADFVAATDPRTTIRALVVEDHRGAVWCAALCAGTVRHLMADAGRTALRLAMLWAQGVPVSRWRRWSAFTAADAASAASAAGGTRGATDAASLAAHATDRPVLAPYAVDYAIYAAGGPAGAADAAREQHISRLSELVRHQVAPLDPRNLAHPLVDWALERSDPRPYREGSLGESLAWAWQHRMRWWGPERLLAERRLVAPQRYRGAG